MTQPLLLTVHRGGGHYAPENTLYAIKKGLTFPGDAVEFDVQFTKDHIPVVFHDETLERTTTSKAPYKINDLTYEDLKQYDVVGWYDQTIPFEHAVTLEEALRVLKGKKKVFIELKGHDPQLGPIIHSILTSLDMIDDVVIISFHQDILLDIQSVLPTVKTTFLLSKWKRPLSELVALPFDYIGPSYKYAFLKKRFVKYLISHDKPVHVWSANSPYIIRKLIKWGVTGITTDEPIKAYHAIKKQSTRK